MPRHNDKFTYHPASPMSPLKRGIIACTVIALALALSIAAIYLVHRHLYLDNDFFTLQDIDLQTDTPEAKKAIEDHLIKTDIMPGRITLPRLNLREIKNELLARFPLVESIKLRRHFPKTLVITVKERRPVAILKFLDKNTKKTTFFKVDKDGVVLPPDTPAASSALPTVTGISSIDGLKEGEKTRNKSILAFLAFLKERDLRPEGSFYEVTICSLDETNEELTLVLNAKGPFKQSSRIVLPQNQIGQALDNLKVIVQLRMESNKTISYVNATYEHIPVRP